MRGPHLAKGPYSWPTRSPNTHRLINNASTLIKLGALLQIAELQLTVGFLFRARRKMAVGLRLVTERVGAGAGVPVLDSGNGEELIHVQPGVSIVLANRPPDSPGTLYISSKYSLSLSRDTDICIYFYVYSPLCINYIFLFLTCVDWWIGCEGKWCG